MPPTALPVASLSNILGKGPTAPRLQEFYTLGPVLGKGAFGTVYQAVDKKTGVAYACKSISKAKLVCKEDIEDVQRVRAPFDWLVLSLDPHDSAITCHSNLGSLRLAFQTPALMLDTCMYRRWRCCIL